MFKGFFRRIGASFVAGIWIVTIVPIVFQGLISMILKGIIGDRPIDSDMIIQFFIIMMIPAVLSVLLMFFFVNRWRRSLENAGKIWFNTIKPLYLFLIVLFSVILGSAITMLLNNQPHYFFQSLVPANSYASKVLLMIPIISGLSYILIQPLYCFAWLLICDLPPRRFSLIFAGFISWLAADAIFKQFVTFFSMFAHPSNLNLKIILQVLAPQNFVILPNLGFGGVAFICYCVMALIYNFRQKRSILTA